MSTEKNRKQVELMKQQLGFFVQGKVELGELITELEVLLSEMVNPEPAWQKNCFEKVTNLATIYTEAMSQKTNELASAREEVLVQNIYQLIKLTNA